MLAKPLSIDLQTNCTKRKPTGSVLMNVCPNALPEIGAGLNASGY